MFARQKAITAATTSIRTRVVLSLSVLLTFAAGILGLAAPAPAAADKAEYLEIVQPKFAYMSESQLLSAGRMVCDATHRGAPSSAAVDIVSKNLGVSVPAAFEIVTASVIYLGC
jgi:hypothetical protein